jgi:CRP-like cAMP-binding protein
MARDNQRFCQLLLSFLVAKSRQLQESLADQLFENSEKRLAKILCSLAGIEDEDARRGFVPRITHETFAGMVGTTRPRISFFMNRFRKLGFIEYKNGELYVNRSLREYVRRR